MRFLNLGFRETLPDRPSESDLWDRWGRNARWFTAEFLIVLAGVFVALALDAWWQGRVDVAREETYLRQMAQDLLETERLILRTDSINRPRARRNGKIVRAFHSARRPPEDSVVAWVRGSLTYRPVAPIMGTVEALVETGDLNLLRNDSLRAAVTRYIGALETEQRRQETWNEEWFRAANSVVDRVDMAELAVRLNSQPRLDSGARSDIHAIVPAGELIFPFGRFDAEAFLTDREAFLGLLRTNTWMWNLGLSRESMLEETRALRASVMAELGD